MNTTHNRKKSVIAAVGAAVAAAAVPAFLFAGAGTAQAYTGINLTPDKSGVTVHIKSVGMCLITKEPGLRLSPHYDCVDTPEAQEWGKAQISSSTSSEKCTYTAIPQTFGPIPVYDHKFDLAPAGTADLWFAGIATGATWDVTIHCPNGTDSGTQQVVY